MKSQARATDRLLAVLAVVGLGVTSGCTICPSPYDYSGPVPNGSVTQNDFCARSGGTRPLRAAPLVWPAIVQAGQKSVNTPAKTLEADGQEGGEDRVLFASAADAETDTGSSSSGVITTSAESEVEQEEFLWRRPAG